MFKKLTIISFAFLLLNLSNQSFAENDEKLVILQTPLGKMVIEFFPNDAPKHVDNFINLTESEFYDRTIFHRVIKDFMIQGGDPITKPGAYDSSTEWGTGNPGYTIQAEFNDIKHNRGIVSMARSADPDSAGSQFFIVHKDSNFLDEEYTVFGRLATQESFETLDKIANLETVPGFDRPFDWGKTEILKAEVVTRSEVSDLLDLGEPQRTSTITEPEIITASNEPYVNKKLGISFLGPPGWAIQELRKTNPNVPDIAVVGPTVDDMSPSISVSIEFSQGKTLTDQVKVMIGSLDDAIFRGELKILSEESRLVNDNSAYVIEALGIVKLQNGTIQVHYKDVIMEHSGKFYFLRYVNTDENFESSLPHFDNFLNSFTILSEDFEDFEPPKNGDVIENGGGCLIATATYGSELALQVQQLRELRDNVLLETNSGSAFMTSFNQFYYSFSPVIADWERENPVFKETVKLTITPLLTSLSILNHVDIDSEEEMIGYGIGVILLNVGFYFVAPAFIIHRLRK